MFSHSLAYVYVSAFDGWQRADGVSACNAAWAMATEIDAILTIQTTFHSRISVVADGVLINISACILKLWRYLRLGISSGSSFADVAALLATDVSSS